MLCSQIVAFYFTYVFSLDTTVIKTEFVQLFCGKRNTSEDLIVTCFIVGSTSQTNKILG